MVITLIKNQVIRNVVLRANFQDSQRVLLSANVEQYQKLLTVKSNNGGIRPWQELINGVGSETITTTKAVFDTDILIIFRNGLNCIKDDNLSEVNTYKILNGAIVLDSALLVDEKILITKFY